jgi:phosphoenolpyruvate carboxykinase (ATP)
MFALINQIKFNIMVLTKDLISGKVIYYNLSPKQLTNIALDKGEGILADNGALVCKTGEFTGRSPQDRYIVRDDSTKESVDWGKVNLPIDTYFFWMIYQRMLRNLENKEIFVRDLVAGADPAYQMPIRVYNTKAFHNLFCYNMFVRPEEDQIQEPQFRIICDPDFKADPDTDGVANENFAIINFSEKVILIGGTGYTGEMKKGIFSVMNFLLPSKKNALTMHCSVNTSKNKDTAVFFGLSGTGKTTLSADNERLLIGDDEHVWVGDKVFNIEGGCYAKTIDLSEEKEPEIFNAIREGAIVENMVFKPGTKELDFKNSTITENMRVSYPIHHIPSASKSSVASSPKNIFFLTCDAFGVLPPISKLSTAQAKYHFISGYTAKVSGTEMGITEPQKTFSACFGAPFLPLHPMRYAELLGKKLKDNNINVWLINTGWTGGGYGEGKRISLSYTRALIRAVMNGFLRDVKFTKQEIFNLLIPSVCPGVPSEILDPKSTWKNKDDWYESAEKLAGSFHANFEKYAANADEETMVGAPEQSFMAVL